MIVFTQANCLVELSAAQRQIVLADAKRHFLGLPHHLQTIELMFRRLRLTDEFGTPDRLPPKPYLREGLRLEALTMLREQDLRTPHKEPKWAKLMPSDGVFGFQFNIDFHPTRRQFLDGDPAKSWATIHTVTRNWSTHTDRSTFPLRGLIPIERDGLLGASRNIGVSSIVSSAIRLHGQMMLCGQASGTIAYVALKHGIQPRDVAKTTARIAEVQTILIRGVGGPGVLIWPYHDLAPDHPAFVAANNLSIKGIWKSDPDSVFFRPEAPITETEWKAVRGRMPDGARRTLPGQAPASRGEAARSNAAALRVSP